MDAEVELPSFKSAAEVIRHNLLSVIRKLMKRIQDEGRAVTYKIRPERSYARVSMQPIQSWNLKKSAKIAAFQKRPETRLSGRHWL